MLIDRELKKINAAIIGASPHDALRLHAAQQALAWASDPSCFKSPYDAIMGIQGGSTDCSDAIRLPQSSSIHAHCEPR